MIDETQKVYRALRTRGIQEARDSLSMIVGRDTGNLNDTDISRATVETIAEGTVDGVFSPIFFYAVGGLPLAWAFKAVSTLDSMVGYKNKQYRDFGWASARLDDLANWIPARLSIVIIPAAALCIGQDSRNALRIGFRDRLKHSSPNAGHAESAYAGALGVYLGGTSFYGGQRNVKPVLNEGERSPSSKDIKQAWFLLIVSTILFIGLMTLVFAGILPAVDTLPKNIVSSNPSNYTGGSPCNSTGIYLGILGTTGEHRPRSSSLDTGHWISNVGIALGAIRLLNPRRRDSYSVVIRPAKEIVR